MAEKNELLPCPFCGGEADFQKKGHELFVLCSGCYVSIGPFSVKWTRPPSPQVDEVVKKFREKFLGHELEIDENGKVDLSGRDKEMESWLRTVLNERGGRVRCKTKNDIKKIDKLKTKLWDMSGKDDWIAYHRYPYVLSRKVINFINRVPLFLRARVGKALEGRTNRFCTLHGNESEQTFRIYPIIIWLKASINERKKITLEQERHLKIAIKEKKEEDLYNL